MSKKKVGCGCLGCSIPLVTFLVLLVLIVPLSVWGFLSGGFSNANVPAWLKVPSPHVSLPAEVIFNIGPLPVTNTIITSWVTMALLIIIALLVTRKSKLIPSRLQSIMESVIEYMYNFCKDVAGETNGRRFFPIVTTIFLFVVINALMALIPGYNSILAVTNEGSVPLLRGANTDINTGLALALISFVFVEFWGFKANGLGYLKKFFDIRRSIQGWGKVFHGKMKSGLGDIGFGFIDTVIGFLELILEFIRIIAFTFRLFGNMLGGEILVLILFFLLVFAGFGAIPVVYSFEMLVGVVQALIFSGLTLVFAYMAVTPHEEEEHKEKS